MKALHRIACHLLAAYLAAGACAAFAADPFPVRPVRIVVPYAPGGLSDQAARTVSKPLSGLLGQPVVVENRPGANAIVGSDVVAKSSPDGYTLLLITDAHTINPGLQKSLPYDSARDFVPIAMIGIAPLVVVTHPSLKVKTFAELIALAKQQPIPYGTSGTGSPAHLAGALLNLRAGTKFNHVPYKGAGPALVDLLAGHIPLMFNALPTTMPYLKSGQLHGLAVGTTTRSSALPDLPAVAELGFEGYNASTFVAVMAPAKTPREVVQILVQRFAQATKSAEVTEWIRSQGLNRGPETAEELGAELAALTRQWRTVIQESGIKAE